MKTARAFKLAFQPGTTYDEADRSSLVAARLAMVGYDVFVAGSATLNYVGGHPDAFASGTSSVAGAWIAFARIAIVIVVATQVVRVSLVRLLGPRRWPLMNHWLWARIALLPPYMGFIIGLPAGLWWAVAFDGTSWRALLPAHLLSGGAMVGVMFVLALRRPFALRAQAPRRRVRKARLR